MKKLIVVCFLLSASLTQVFGQDDSYSSGNRRAQLSRDTMTVDVMVIPANKRLYNSFFDRQIMEANDISFEALRDTILASLAHQVAHAFNDSLPSGVIPESNSPYPEDMAFVYESFNYTYDLLPAPKKKETTLSKWKKKIPKKQSKPTPKKGTFMENGQIVTHLDTDPKFTNIDLLNTNFLFILNQRYSATTFVFINHYEMVIPDQVSQTELQSDNYPRIIKVHYTVTDVAGKELNSGMVTLNSSSYDDQLDYLIGTSFYQIGQKIKSNLAESQ